MKIATSALLSQRLNTQSLRGFPTRPGRMALLALYLPLGDFVGAAFQRLD